IIIAFDEPKFADQEPTQQQRTDRGVADPACTIAFEERRFHPGDLPDGVEGPEATSGDAPSVPPAPANTEEATQPPEAEPQWLREYFRYSATPRVAKLLTESEVAALLIAENRVIATAISGKLTTKRNTLAQRLVLSAVVALILEFVNTQGVLDAFTNEEQTQIVNVLRM
ncbi:hypothetical protein BVRB_035240, partial [Beta vulgaris subsp. vulgaris]